MLLAEVAPMSSTHSASSEFSSREISPMPLDRRVSFCGTAEPAVWFEEFRKNFITLSETDAIEDAPGRDQLAVLTKTQAPPPSRPLSGYQPSLSGTRPLQWRCAAWSRRRLPQPTFASPRDRKRSRFHPTYPGSQRPWRSRWPSHFRSAQPSGCVCEAQCFLRRCHPRTSLRIPTTLP